MVVMPAYENVTTTTQLLVKTLHALCLWIIVKLSIENVHLVFQLESCVSLQRLLGLFFSSQKVLVWFCFALPRLLLYFGRDFHDPPEGLSIAIQIVSSHHLIIRQALKSHDKYWTPIYVRSTAMPDEEFKSQFFTTNFSQSLNKLFSFFAYRDLHFFKT